jgi:hypothetical protein
MGLQQQQATAKVSDFTLVLPDVAAAAMRYQAFREVEAEHLAIMAKFNLAADWTPEIRQIVFNAGDHVRHARDARMKFRRLVRDFVVERRLAREPLSAVLRQTRAMLHLLEASGALRGDGGWLEAEVLEWAIDEYENAA